ncbi:MAG: hypothetical protein AAFY10_04530, partial [Pseudomonadota bacterium]
PFPNAGRAEMLALNDRIEDSALIQLEFSTKRGREPQDCLLSAAESWLRENNAAVKKGRKINRHPKVPKSL